MDLSVYKRPNKPKVIPVNSRKHLEVDPENFTKDIEQPLEVDSFTECHVTPAEVAERMVDYLEACPNMTTLEPECGTGNLIHALLESGHSAGEVIGIERHHALASQTRKRFNCEVTIMQEDFLEYAEKWPSGGYPRIIMNPPFKHVRKHMEAAIKMLGNAGHHDAILIALVPVTYEHPLAETMETLDNQTFPNAKVHTKIIKIVE